MARSAASTWVREPCRSISHMSWMQVNHAGSRNVTELLQVSGFETGEGGGGRGRAATMREPHSYRGIIRVGRNLSYHPGVRVSGISVTDGSIRKVEGLTGLRLPLRTMSPT